MKLRKTALLALLAIGLSTPVWADDVAARLKVIEDKQDEILAKLANIQSELAIVKIRATQ